MYSIEIIFLSYLQRGINKEILIVLPAVSMIVSRSQQTLIKADFFLAHLPERVMPAIVITWHPSSVIHPKTFILLTSPLKTLVQL